jgi:hypothetical protein
MEGMQVCSFLMLIQFLAVLFPGSALAPEPRLIFCILSKSLTKLGHFTLAFLPWWLPINVESYSLASGSNLIC